MDKNAIVQQIENFAPLELAETWDCSGWIVNNPLINEVNTIMLCLTVTDEVIKQALESDCQMIISHHPLFVVPLNYKELNIYCAHTNLDKAHGGTTDTLMECLNMPQGEVLDFLRITE